MAGMSDVVGFQLQMNQSVFEQFTSDFTDDDAKFVPAPGSPNLNWILCHLATTEDDIVSKVTGKPRVLAPELHEAYKGGSKCNPDDGMTRAEAWRLFTKARAATLTCVKEIDERRLTEPTGGGPNAMFKTVGDFVALLGAHGFWHFGQLTVIRRMLGKPARFGG